MANWLGEVQRSMAQERWWRVSGNASLNPRGMAIVRELWRWRQAEAQRRNKPPRRMLRDDLIVEMARRQTADPKQIQAVRGMEWGSLRRQIPQLAECIRRALETPESEGPPGLPRDIVPQLSLLGQFLSAALGSICRQMQLAPGLVGGPSDVRELILHRIAAEGDPAAEPPALGRGWRAEVVGHSFEDLLAGKMAVRISDPLSEHPLVIEGRETRKSERGTRN